MECGTMEIRNMEKKEKRQRPNRQKTCPKGPSMARRPRKTGKPQGRNRGNTPGSRNGTTWRTTEGRKRPGMTGRNQDAEAEKANKNMMTAKGRKRADRTTPELDRTTPEAGQDHTRGRTGPHRGQEKGGAGPRRAGTGPHQRQDRTTPEAGTGPRQNGHTGQEKGGGQEGRT